MNKTKYAQIDKSNNIVIAVLVMAFKPEFDKKTMSLYDFILCDDSVKVSDLYKNKKFISTPNTLSKEEIKQFELSAIADDYAKKRALLLPSDPSILALWREQEKEVVLYADNPKAHLPVIETLCKRLDVTKTVYVKKVASKIEAYKVANADLLAMQYKEEAEVQNRA